MLKHISPDTVDTIRTGGIGVTGSTYSLMGLPWGEIAAIGTAVFVILKIFLALLDLKDRYFPRKK